MTLEEFAKSCGCIIKTCDDGWGGKIAFTTKDNPQINFCGYKTATAAYKGWLDATFGPAAKKGILRLLKKANRG